MAINPDAVGTKGEPAERTWTSKDCLLYAIGVGAGLDELPFTTENSEGITQRVLPTFAVIAGAGGGGAFSKIGEFNWAMLVHGEQQVTLHQPLPVEGKATMTGKIANIWDKGKAAVVELENEAVDQNGKPLFTTKMSAFIRGEGGWGGERGPSNDAFWQSDFSGALLHALIAVR